MKPYSREELEELLESPIITDEFRTRIEAALQMGGDAIDMLGEPGSNVLPTSCDVVPELLGERRKLGIDVEQLVDGDNRAARTAVDRIVPVTRILDFDFLNLKRGSFAFWAFWCGHVLFGFGLCWILRRACEGPNESSSATGAEREGEP